MFRNSQGRGKYVNNFEDAMKKGQEKLNNTNYKEAIVYFEQALALATEHPPKNANDHAAQLFRAHAFLCDAYNGNKDNLSTYFHLGEAGKWMGKIRRRFNTKEMEAFDITTAYSMKYSQYIQMDTAIQNETAQGHTHFRNGQYEQALPYLENVKKLLDEIPQWMDHHSTYKEIVRDEIKYIKEIIEKDNADVAKDQIRRQDSWVADVSPDSETPRPRK